MSDGPKDPTGTPIFSIGYGRTPLETFFSYLNEHQIERLIDVETVVNDAQGDLFD